MGPAGAGLKALTVYTVLFVKTTSGGTAGFLPDLALLLTEPSRGAFSVLEVLRLLVWSGMGVCKCVGRRFLRCTPGFSANWRTDTAWTSSWSSLQPILEKGESWVLWGMGVSCLVSRRSGWIAWTHGTPFNDLKQRFFKNYNKCEKNLSTWVTNGA